MSAAKDLGNELRCLFWVKEVGDCGYANKVAHRPRLNKMDSSKLEMVRKAYLHWKAERFAYPGDRPDRRRFL
ncbi:MAG TPA: hypothetical protein PKJ05_03420 [Bacillota bacterium]|nr:hypothetical protein [Bacillota bacterium]